MAQDNKNGQIKGAKSMQSNAVAQLRRLDQRWIGAHLAPLSLVLVLAACGGGGGSSTPPVTPPPPAPTVTALDDQYTIPAGPLAALNVMANDRTSGGSATLNVATAPAHGKVTVQGTTLQYTPDAGFYGADQFSYRAESGAAHSTATVKLTVEAVIEMIGSVKPAAANGMSVIAQVGDQQFSTTTDAQGVYELSIRTARPDAFVTLTATGKGAQAHLVMSSQVGDFASLYARLAGAARLDEAREPALRLDGLSSARQGLLKIQDTQPTSSTTLRAALDRVNPVDLIDTTTQFRRVAEGGAALPDGVPTTLALVSSASALAEAYKKSLSGDGYQGMSSTADVVADTTPPTVGTQGTRLAVFGRVDAVFDLQADGTVAFYDSWNGQRLKRQARWTSEGNTLSVNVTAPFVQSGSGYTYQTFQLRKVRSANSQAKPQLMMRDLATYWFCQNPPTNTCATAWSEWAPVVSFDVERDRLPLKMEDFAASTRWAGPTIGPHAGYAAALGSRGELVFNGTLNVGGLSGQLVDGRLRLSGWNASGYGPNGSDFAFIYTRLWQGDDGIEYWLAEGEVDGKTFSMRLLPVVKAPEVTLIASQAARRWLIPGGLPGLKNYSSSGNQELLRSNGSWLTVIGNATTQSASRTWTLSADGKELRFLSNGFSLGDYQIAAKVSDGYLAFADETLVRMRDLGPAD